jgi:thioester reductase-like protein
MGYARSKLVTENIIKAAASKTGMRGRVLRVGQIVGDSATGLWNSTEAIPLMIRSATTIGALPELDETPSWMPSDLVAKAILELSGVIPSVSSSFASITEDDNVVYHVQNSHLFHWTNDLLPALRSSGLEFRNVSQREWVQLLRESDIDPVKNPTIKLLDFFAEKYDNEKAGRKALVFATEKSGIVSKTVASGYDVVYSGLVGKMVQKWKMEWAV